MKIELQTDEIGGAFEDNCRFSFGQGACAAARNSLNSLQEPNSS